MPILEPQILKPKILKPQILGKTLFSLVFGIALTAQASAQADKQQLITTVETELNVTDLTQDVTALYVNCSLFTDSEDIDERLVADGYAVLFDDGAFPAGVNTENNPSVEFISVQGFPKSGVKQSISVNIFGPPRAEFWTTGECSLAITNKNYTATTDWKKTIDFAFAEGGEQPMDCNADRTAPEDIYLCVSPQSKANLSVVEFTRFDKTPGSRKN